MWKWKGIIEDILQVKNYSQTRIATEVSVSKEAISKLMRGVTKEPRYGTGSRLLALHLKLRPDLYDNKEPRQTDSGFKWTDFLPETHPNYEPIVDAELEKTTTQ